MGDCHSTADLIHIHSFIHSFIHSLSLSLSPTLLSFLHCLSLPLYLLPSLSLLLSFALFSIFPLSLTICLFPFLTLCWCGTAFCFGGAAAQLLEVPPPPPTLAPCRGTGNASRAAGRHTRAPERNASRAAPAPQTLPMTKPLETHIHTLMHIHSHIHTCTHTNTH